MNPAYELNCEHDKPLKYCCLCMAAEVDRLRARIHEIQCQHDKQTATLRKECDLYRSFHDGRLEIMQQRYDMMTAPQRRAERAEQSLRLSHAAELKAKAEAFELRKEISRLKRGDFTPEELQDLCHNLSEDDYQAFCDGCDAYQRKLFGRCRSDEKIQYAADAISRFSELQDRVRRVENQNPFIGGCE